MAEPFRAIGFNITDELSYQALAELARRGGALSQARRSAGTIHGFCWSLGAGLEVWTMLYEAKHEIVYVDCRPAFRSQHIVSLHPWQIVEYVEDGEALATGVLLGSETELFFELQNLTEIDPQQYREQPISAAVSGLAYHARINKRAGKPLFELLNKHQPRRKANDSDYVVRGTVLAHRELKNPQTGNELVWMDVDVGRMKIEVLANRAELQGEPQRGAWLSAEVWLQGHVLNDRDLQARYEGLDYEVPPEAFWRKLRREN